MPSFETDQLSSALNVEWLLTKLKSNIDDEVSQLLAEKSANKTMGGESMLSNKTLAELALNEPNLTRP